MKNAFTYLLLSLKNFEWNLSKDDIIQERGFFLNREGYFQGANCLWLILHFFHFF